MKEQIIEKILEKYLFSEKEQENENESIFIWKYVILRCRNAWVHFWKLLYAKNGVYRLEDSRRLYYWKTIKWISLSELAEFWINKKESKICTKIKLIEITEKEFIWFEDLIDLVEQCASAPIYPLLKREDEKFVTELAYNNPKFVEDLVREVYSKLLEKYKSRISKIKVEVTSDESIHQHEAFAVIEK